MIHTVIERKNHRIVSLRVKGHALYANPGEDLVCAGVSSIMTGALNGADELFPDACRLTMKNNQMSIQVLKDCDPLQAALGMVECQLATMQEAYPEYIQLEKKEV